jgi:hypothetical protein
MTIELAIVISIISVSASVIFGFATWRRNTSTDAKQDAGQQATIITKLDGIEKGVDDIKEELKNVKSEVREDHDRIIRLEESTKQAHKRLDLAGTKREE